MKLKLRIGLFLLLFLFSLPFNLLSSKKIKVYKTDADIILDGVLDEPFWFDCELVDNFYQQFPDDSIKSKLLTEVRIAYSDQRIFLSGKMYDSVPEKYLINSLKRDFGGPENESVTFTFDTYNDQKNAFNFGITPYNVQREVLISEGGTSTWGGGGGRSSGPSWFNSTWNTRWESYVKKYDDYWVVELSIPFKSLRYRKDSRIWGFNVWRNNVATNEKSNWTTIPKGYNMYNLSYAGKIEFDTDLPFSGKNIILIPYISGSGFDDKIGLEDKKFKPEFGLDLKVGLTSSLNLDITVNPDFSQVEVDEQRTNLTRFELMYPEKREFFIENSDLFSDVGDYRNRPFFSRRIGITYDSIQEQYIQNPIIFGAKLSGKIGENYRVGILNMQTQKLSSINQQGVNYGMAVVERRIFSNSRISTFLINKQPINNDNFIFQSFNRVAGVELKLLSNNTNFSSDLFYNQSFDNFKTKNTYSWGGNAVYTNSKIRITNYFSKVAENYNPEVGFIRRKNIFFYSPSVRYLFYPEKGKVNNHGPEIDYEFYNHPVYGDTDRKLELQYSISLNNSSRFSFDLEKSYTFLLEEFDPTRSGVEYLPSETGYNYNRYSINYNSNTQKPFSFRLNSKVGGFFNGDIYTYGLSINYKFVPHVNMDFSYSNNKIKLPYASSNLASYSTKVEVSFNTKLFLTTFFQYNSQIDNINLNTRLQWNFKPLSDIYLVYTDNYFAKGSELFNLKNRSLALKFNYWINI
tara:strand:- start:101 stop:2332 length:2232 start_codon:yes stop_codon:yes gene_type:complete